MESFFRRIGSRVMERSAIAAKIRKLRERLDEIDGKTRYVCPICGREFKSRQWLESGHLRECTRRRRPSLFKAGEAVRNRESGRLYEIVAENNVISHDDGFRYSSEWEYAVRGDGGCMAIADEATLLELFDRCGR